VDDLELAGMATPTIRSRVLRRRERSKRKERPKAAAFAPIRKMVLRKATTKYGLLVVLIRHGSAEIWGFKY
jgi:hypothetical protein